ncbi:MAG: chemotaxis protein CheD [Myxococcales bacterium]|nr:chemotaxis protein CheD [Myxococcales bacterium]
MSGQLAHTPDAGVLEALAYDRQTLCEVRSSPSAVSAVPESTDYLYPGQLFASPEPSTVMTVLGSCVAVCLWDAEAGVGGLNHYLLPRGIGQGMSALRYGSLAVPELIRRVLAFGARPSCIRAKIFGGACLNGDGAGRLSRENIEIARDCLAQALIPVVAESVGGHFGRKLLFRIPDGDVWVKTV